MSARSEPGHWEGDLIIGKNNNSALVTLVERVSRMTIIAALPEGRDAKHCATVVSAALRTQPAHLVKTLTWDQGRELAQWQHIETALGIDIYICEPRSPWQRPTNEQTNGLLRRWLPKGTDLNIGEQALTTIHTTFNTMPRKLHNWKNSQTHLQSTDSQPPLEFAGSVKLNAGSRSTRKLCDPQATRNTTSR